MHDDLQREFHKPYGPSTSVTWLQLLPSQRTKTGTCIAPTNLLLTRLRACSRLVTC